MPYKSDIKPIAAFTGLRGLAALWVVAYHFRDSLAGQISPFAMSVLGQGFLAVDAFFILSGFIIYLNYRWILEDLNPRSVGTFILARLARIYPVHLFVSFLFLMNPLCISLFSRAKDIGTHYGVGYYFMSLFLVHNWGFADRVEWNVPSWSISTEWFAYLLFPILLLSIGRNKTNPVAVVGEMVCVLIALAAIYSFAGVNSIDDDIPHLGLIRCILEFVVGTGLCRFYLLTNAPKSFSIGLLLTLALAAIILTVSIDIPDYFLLPSALALLILCLTAEHAFLSRLMVCRLPLILGEISYSIYMIHYFVKDWVKFLSPGDATPTPFVFFLYIALVLCAGFAIYIFVEKPSRLFFRALAAKKVASSHA